ncbi:MAG: hypothetical protein GXX93_13365 [Anaerolineae bacterium]|nr:hypothetical protein [Anaerolineae bacterium]
MSVRRLTCMVAILVVMGLVLAGCGGATAPAPEATAVPEAEEVVAPVEAEGERTGAWLDTIVLVE